MTRGLARLRTWLNSIPIQDPIQRQMASLLQAVLLGLIVLIIVVTLVLLVLPGSSAEERFSLLVGDLFGVLVVLLPFTLLRRGFFHAALWLMIAVLILTPALAILVLFDLLRNGGVLFQFTLAIFLASLLADRRILLLVFGLSAALVAFSAYQMHVAGMGQAGPVTDTAVNFILFNGLIALFLDRFGGTLRTALSAALLRESELQGEIAHRKQAEVRFRDVVESAPDAILLVDRRGTIMLANAQAQKFFGFDRAELVGSHVDRLVPQRYRHGHGSFRDGFLADPQARPMGAGRDLYAVRKDGSEFPVEIGLTPIETQEGLMVVASIVDISERKSAERQNRFLARLVAGVSDAIIAVDLQQNIQSWNTGAETLYGWAEEEVLGKPARNVLDTEFFEITRDEVTRQIMEEGFWSGEALQLRRDGTRVPVLSSVSLYNDLEGRPAGIVALNRDITDRKRAEEEIHSLNQELEARVRERTNQLEAANKELEAFSYSVSHDLRAPLRAIIGFTRILLEDYEPQLDSEGKRLFNVVRHEAQRMGELIDDLLTFSRLGRAEMRYVLIDMRIMVDKLFDELTTPEARARIDFRAGPLPTAFGDPALVRQVWVNLITNAIKFSSGRERAIIEVDGMQNKHEVIYTIRDNGAGFDMDYADKLFGVFQRLHSEHEFEGTGVGLAIVQRVVLRHGGRVWGEGEPEKGARFHFALPRKGEIS